MTYSQAFQASEAVELWTRDGHPVHVLLAGGKRWLTGDEREWAAVLPEVTEAGLSADGYVFVRTVAG